MIKSGWKLVLGLVFAFSACNVHSVPFVVIEFQSLNVNLFVAETGSFREIKFEEASVAPKFESNRYAVVQGSGLVVVRNVRIHYGSTQIYINDQVISLSDGKVQNFVLMPDGKLQVGFLRSFK